MRLALFVFSLFCLTVSTAQNLPTELLTPEIVSVNRMPMRAEAFAYESKALAEKRVKENSKNFLSLNGQWKFNWGNEPKRQAKRVFYTGI